MPLLVLSVDSESHQQFQWSVYTEESVLLEAVEHVSLQSLEETRSRNPM